MTPLIIYAIAFLLYALFWSWYVGFGRKASPELIADTLKSVEGTEWDGEKAEGLRKFLEKDDGKDFVMVNVLQLKRPVRESMTLLNRYLKAFQSALLKRAGHPVIFAVSAGGNIEDLGCVSQTRWSSAAFMRYRSRSDFAYIIQEFAGSDSHGFKLQALDKTFAFPAAPWFMIASPRWIVALVLALSATLIHLAVI